MGMNWLIFAYFGPETMLPLTSIVATIAGFAMLLGRGSLRYVLYLFRRIRTRRRRDHHVIARPHIKLGDAASAGPKGRAFGRIAAGSGEKSVEGGHDQ
jgi:hypothetical protein